MVYIYDKYIDWARGLPPKNKRATNKRINVNMTYEWRNAETEACLARAPADGKRGRPPQRGHERPGTRVAQKEATTCPVSNGAGGRTVSYEISPRLRTSDCNRR